MGSAPTFISYEKIAERPVEWELDERAYRALSRQEWVVTEKIHGANFVVLSDSSRVWFAKRKALLQPDEEFFGYQILAPSLTTMARRLFEGLKAEIVDLTQIAVHGELFGGAYPHPAVPQDPRVEAVQTGIYYSPTIQFCTFDIAVFREANERTYLDFRKAHEAAQQAGFLFATPLFIGPYEKAIAYPLGFDSTLPARWGLPPLDGSNKAEGIVIKPVEPFVTLAEGRRIRPVLKKKIPEFNEDPRFQEARKWTKVVGPGVQDEQAALDLLKQEILDQSNSTRFRSAESKVGRIRDVGSPLSHEAMSLLANDLQDHLRLNCADILNAVSPFARRELDIFIDETARGLVKAEIAARNLKGKTDSRD